MTGTRPFTAGSGWKHEEALTLVSSWMRRLMRPRWRTSPTAEALGSDADRARQPDGEHQVTPPELFFDPC